MSVASGLRVWDEQGLGWNHADVFCLYMFVCFRKCDQRAGLVRAGRGKRLFGFAILRTAVAAHRVLMFEGFDFSLLHLVLVHQQKSTIRFGATFEFGEGWPLGQSCKGVTQSSLGIYLIGCLSSTIAPVSSGRPEESFKWMTLRLWFWSIWRLKTKNT